MSATQATAVLEIRNLHVWFDLARGSRLHAVRGVDLVVERGTRVGLVGESGCGKSTIMLALLGLLPPSATVAGEVWLDGEEVLAAGEKAIRPHRWRDIAIVFQGAMNALNPVRTIGAQIAEPLELHGIASGREARRRAAELLETVGISAHRANRYPHEFSGGMRQRVGIAMALACEPKILIADEPTTALDVMVQAQILELLQDLSERLGLALVVVTHDLPIVAQVCHRAAVMYAGKIVESGSTDELFHDPRHPYTRLLFAATPCLDDDFDVASIPGAPPRLDSEVVGCAFAPRCDSALDACSHLRPIDRTIGEGRTVSCHLVDDPEADDDA
jgi:oligopeptide/dipeptide ABC transporter ATP-binding protein